MSPSTGHTLPGSPATISNVSPVFKSDGGGRRGLSSSLRYFAIGPCHAAALAYFDPGEAHRLARFDRLGHLVEFAAAEL